MSIFSSLRYCLGSPTDTTNLYAALAFMPFGLFFDFMDGKVARWRKKASLMGQELDSLADLVRALLPVLHTPKKSMPNHTLADLLWCRPRRCSLRHWSPHPSRPPLPHLLRPLRANPPRPLQRHRRRPPQRRNRQIKIL